MEEKSVKKAAFSIENYKIKRFSYTEHSPALSETLSLAFRPSGKFYPDKNVFVMELVFVGSIENETNPSSDINVIDVVLEASFKFEETLSFDELPPYFFKNTLGIVFPYLRAFVSTLTFQANLNPVILPLLNLTTLERFFKENTEIIQVAE
jgi:preprotein translocase subunit SecB